MQVTVAIPTYGNRGSIFRLLTSLGTQSFKRFEIEVVFKHSNDRKADSETLDRIKDYSGLSINITKQKNGRIPEAMNIIFGVDSDIVINTDDDAFASRNWVKDHYEFHSKHKNVGMATGMVREDAEAKRAHSRINQMLNAQKWRISNFTRIDPPIDSRFADYGMYIGRSGMLVDTGRKHNLIRTFKQHGVNMSWKGDAMEGLGLPPYAPRGHRYEAYMALLIVRRGYHAVWFDKGINFHEMHASSSRGGGITTVPFETILTDVLFSYYVSKFYKVDLNTLRLRTQISDTIAKAITLNRNQGYTRGYRIAYTAITGKWTPETVRKALLREIATAK